MRQKKERPERGATRPAEVSRQGSDDKGKHRAGVDAAQATRALPFPLRVFRASRPHAHDRRRPAAPRTTSTAQLALALDVDGYDPRQRSLFGWAR